MTRLFPPQMLKNRLLGIFFGENNRKFLGAAALKMKA